MRKVVCMDGEQRVAQKVATGVMLLFICSGTHPVGILGLPVANVTACHEQCVHLLRQLGSRQAAPSPALQEEEEVSNIWLMVSRGLSILLYLSSSGSVGQDREE